MIHKKTVKRVNMKKILLSALLIAIATPLVAMESDKSNIREITVQPTELQLKIKELELKEKKLALTENRNYIEELKILTAFISRPEDILHSDTATTSTIELLKISTANLRNKLLKKLPESKEKSAIMYSILEDEERKKYNQMSDQEGNTYYSTYVKNMQNLQKRYIEPYQRKK